MRIRALSFGRCRAWFFLPVVMAIAPVFGLAAPNTYAADKSADKSVATLSDDPALLLLKKDAEKPWQVVHEKNIAFHAGEMILGGFSTALDSENGAVQLRLMGDVNGRSPFPIVETAITLQEPKDVDLAFVMDRGQVDLVNTKKSGSAKVKVTTLGKSALITLMEPGDRIAIEIYGRWPRGVRFVKNPKGPHSPAIAVVAVAIKGEIEIKGETRSATLKAPPGPSLLRFEDLQETDFQIYALKEVPSWVEEKETEHSKNVKLALKHLREVALKSSLPEALEKFVVSDNAYERRVAVFLLAGTDDLTHLAAAMGSTQHIDVWETGVIALRNWIGRGPGQDQILYKVLREKRMYPPGEAETVMQLLHSYGPNDLSKPETYEALIDYLESDRLGIRGLAYWHLSRLVPEGKKIGYNPLATKEERAKAIKEWQKLIPSGTLPGYPKENPKKDNKE